MVSTVLPEICAASVRQPRAVRPSIITVQAPQMPCSQPRCVPVSSSSWRRKSARCWRALTRRFSGLPFSGRFDRDLFVADRGRSCGGPSSQGVEHAARQHRGQVKPGVGAQPRRVVGRQVVADGLRERRKCPASGSRKSGDAAETDCAPWRGRRSRNRRAAPCSMRSRCMVGDRGQADQREIAVAARQLGEADRRAGAASPEISLRRSARRAAGRSRTVL